MPPIPFVSLEIEMNRRMNLGIRPGLERVSKVLDLLDRPQERLGRILLVAGTNGKGSACALADSMLRAAGFRNALYISPHLAHFHERIQLAGLPVPTRDLEPHKVRVAEAEGAAGVTLTGFELVTAVAFDYLATQALDCSVIEVGMGGRYDATNVVRPDVSLIMPIGLDHVEYLGDSILAIAREKFGICRNGVPLVVGKQSAEVDAAIRQWAAESGVEIAEPFACDTGCSWSRFSGAWKANRIEPLAPGLPGSFQVDNAAAALGAVACLTGWHPGFSEGLRSACWPGRFDRRMYRGVPLILDGAHNGHGMQALVSALARDYSDQKFHVLFAAKAGKDVQEVLSTLTPMAATFTFTSLPRLQGIPPGQLASLIDSSTPSRVIENVDDAWEDWLAGPGPRLCCGSLYLVGYCLALMSQDPGPDSTEVVT